MRMLQLDARVDGLTITRGELQAILSRGTEIGLLPAASGEICYSC